MRICREEGASRRAKDWSFCGRWPQASPPSSAADAKWWSTTSAVTTPQPAEPEKIVNVNDLLEELIQQSVALVGKPVVLMNKEDKIRAIQFLSQNGAFLVTKSGDKIAKYFGISKYTLYSYIDTKQQEGKHD